MNSSTQTTDRYVPRPSWSLFLCAMLAGLIVAVLACVTVCTTWYEALTFIFLAAAISLNLHEQIKTTQLTCRLERHR